MPPSLAVSPTPCSDKGVYVIGFSFPVVPKGKARIRTQISAAHTEEDLEFAIAKFAEAKTDMGI